MIPSVPELRYDANEQWRENSHDETAFRQWYVEPTVAQINAAFKAGEIDGETLRLSVDAVLTPVPYRRRFGRKDRMTFQEAHAYLESIGIEVSGVMLPTIAADYGITIVDAHDGPDLDEDLDEDDPDPDNDYAP
jgi:hypothetical protein